VKDSVDDDTALSGPEPAEDRTQDTHGLFLETYPLAEMSPAMARIAETLLSNPQFASYAQGGQIAERANTTAGTVVRFAQSVGYTGWPPLRQELRARYLSGLSTEQTRAEHAPSVTASPVHTAIHRDMANLSAALKIIDPSVISAVIEILGSARQVVVLSSGSYSAPAHVLAHLGATMGLPFRLEDRGGVHLATAISTLDERDALVAVSFWRQFKEIARAARLAREAGVSVVAITDSHRTQVAANAHQTIVVPSEGVSFFQSTSAALSVVYGLLDGLENKNASLTRSQIERTQELWDELDIFEHGTSGRRRSTADSTPPAGSG
jgi:DNA-binding MurR/RpiR family transcriptional regulator